MDPSEFLDLKKRVERIARESDRAIGARDQLLKQLRKGLGWKIEEADENLKELEEEANRLSAKAEKELKRFEKKWREKLL